MTVTFRRDGFVGYVEINHPRVNAIELPVRKGLLHAVHWAESEELERVILSSAGRDFATSANTVELDANLAEPHLTNVLMAIENSFVPWIAAIDGDALGDGAGIALACRMRIIHPCARIGFPDLVLDLNTGMGPMQRLPRLIGIQAALDMIISGKTIDTNAAKALKLVDDIDEDPIYASFMVNAEELLSRVPAIELPNPVTVGAYNSIAGNRILARYEEAADTVLMDGSTPWEIDEAMVEFGFAMGPYEAQDLNGLDTTVLNRHTQMDKHSLLRRSIPIAERLIELGKLGVKTGAGWYRYPSGNGKVDDPIVADIAIEEAHYAGIERVEYPSEEISERLLLSMINEAANTLYEGITQSTQEIDVLSVLGYGFPQSKGGLMHYADGLGVEHIIKQLNKLLEEDAIAWKVSPVLEDCANRDIAICNWRRD